MKPNWLRVVSFKTELLSEYLIHKGYREDLSRLLPKVGLLRNRMIIDNDIYVDLNEVAMVQEVLEEDILTRAQEAYEVIEDQSKKLLALSRDLGESFQKGVSNKYLVEGLGKFFHEYQRTLGMIGIPTIIDLSLEKIIKHHLKASGIEHIDEAFGKLAVSSRVVATNQEREDLLLLAVENKSEKNIKESVRKHARKYGWMHSTLFLGEAYSEELILKELHSFKNPLLELEKLRKDRAMHLDIARETKDLITSKEGRAIARFLGTAVYFRTARLEWMNQTCFLARPFLEGAAHRLNVSFFDFIYLYPEEITGSLSEKTTPPLDLIHE